MTKMSFVQRLYGFLFFILTSFHNFLVTLSGVIEHVNVLQAIKRPRPGLTFLVKDVSAETLLMQNAGCELRKQKKLPLHIACLITEENVNVHRIVSLIRWCAAAGIGCISLYDHNGVLIDSKDLIEALLISIPNNQLGSKQKYYSVHQGFVEENNLGFNETHVFLLSHLEGQSRFAKVAKTLATSYPAGEIDQALVEKELEKMYPKEPELLLQFGSMSSHLTLGYPPWYLHLTEMLCLPSHMTVRADQVASALLIYGRCEQRFGK